MIKRPRQHNEKHLDFIRSLSCVSCGNDTSTEAAHIRMGSPYAGKRPTGMGEKPSDIWTVPLCSSCHRIQHSVGEGTYWKKYARRDPFLLALALWAHTGQHEVGEMIVRAAHE